MSDRLVPRNIGDQPVLCWSAIDERHRITGACRHFDIASGRDDPVPRFVAVVGGPDSYFLMRFTSEWELITDTWHQSMDEAYHQAEFEYAGVSRTWKRI